MEDFVESNGFQGERKRDSSSPTKYKRGEKLKVDCQLISNKVGFIKTLQSLILGPDKRYREKKNLALQTNRLDQFPDKKNFVSI